MTYTRLPRCHKCGDMARTKSRTTSITPGGIVHDSQWSCHTRFAADCAADQRAANGIEEARQS